MPFDTVDTCLLTRCISPIMIARNRPPAYALRLRHGHRSRRLNSVKKGLPSATRTRNCGPYRGLVNGPANVDLSWIAAVCVAVACIRASRRRVRRGLSSAAVAERAQHAGRQQPRIATARKLAGAETDRRASRDLADGTWHHTPRRQTEVPGWHYAPPAPFDRNIAAH